MSAKLSRKDKGSVLETSAQLLKEEIDECPVASPRDECEKMSTPLKTLVDWNSKWRSTRVGLFFAHSNLDVTFAIYKSQTHIYIYIDVGL